MVRIVFDGACSGNPGYGGWAALVILENGNELVVSGSEEASTNNQMELLAAIIGLETVPEPSHIKIIGDSKYVIDGFTKWLPNWKLKGWKTSGNKPVKNIDLWQALEGAVDRHLSVSWEWVKGHSGHPENERVDGIAAKEAQKLSKSFH